MAIARSAFHSRSKGGSAAHSGLGIWQILWLVLQVVRQARVSHTERGLVDKS